jgi:hypothetical protein
MDSAILYTIIRDALRSERPLHSPVTPVEIARHQAAIDRIRARLFRKHTPAEYCILDGSEQILLPSAQIRWNAGCGEYRELTIGGLRYTVDCLDRYGLSTFTVIHQHALEFAFWIQTGRGNTACSLLVQFRKLDDVVFSYVASFRRVNEQPARK